MSFLKKIKLAAIVVITMKVSMSNAIARPLVPNITDVKFDGKIITIEGNVASDDYENVHVVLLSDFTPSLGYVCELGNEHKEGPAINYVHNEFPISFEPSLQSRVRYFVAAATSKKNEDSIRVFSGWKVYTDSSGMPLSISTSSGDKGENLFYRARRINEKNSKEIVYDLTFSLPKSRASECKLILKHNGTPKLNISDLSNIPNAKTDIKEALNDTTGAGSGKLHFKSETPDFYLYRFYGYLEANADDSFDVTLIDTAGLVMDTLKSPVGISEDSGHMNIISTIYALTAMPLGTTDPLNTDSIATLSDSAKLKLLITAMVDLSLAHNSPKPDENEQSQGIFTNYMQFMDNVVGKWDSLAGASAGINRLERINDIIMKANRTKIIDPVYIKNHGTLTEYGFPVHKQQRKNYAFYEGYTRMHVDMELWPDSNRHEKTGIGVMFRVSDNIELYEADLADTFNMFKKPFLRGDSLNRRIIFKSNDSILNKVDEDGLWVKGKDGNLSNESYYTGISPVRLPVGSLINAINTDSSFALPIERSVTDDPYGTLLMNAESNIFKVFSLSVNPDGTEDTLRNDGNPEVLLHHQRRIVEIDTNYFGKDVINKLDVVRMDTGSRKIFVQQDNSFSATIIDTSEADNVAIQVRISRNGEQIFVGDRFLLVTKFFSEGAENGSIYNKGVAGHPIEVKLVDIDSVKIAKIADKDSDKVFIYITKPENVEICKSSDPMDKWIDWEKQPMPISWSDYKKMMKKRESLFFYSDKNCNETVTIDIYLPMLLMRKVNRKISNIKSSFIRENIVCDFRKDNQIVLEPINNDIVPGTLSEVYNPSCVVKNENAWFKVEVSGPEFKDANIVWRSKKNLVKFVDGPLLEDVGRGNTVEVRGISTGEDTLEVYIEDYNGVKPSIELSVVEWKEVDLFTYIVKNETGTDSAWTDTEASIKIDTVNSILKQVGVKLKLIRKKGPDRDKYIDISSDTDFRALCHVNRGTGGLELYLVRNVSGNLVAGNLINAGIVVPKKSGLNDISSRDITHEIFHSARQLTDDPYLLQVYDIYEKSSFRHLIRDDLGIIKTNIPQDFGTNYYRSDLNHTSLIKKLLQYGYIGYNDAIDIPRGTVFGVAEEINKKNAYEKRQVECGYLRVNERVLIHRN